MAKSGFSFLSLLGITNSPESSPESLPKNAANNHVYDVQIVPGESKAESTAKITVDKGAVEQIEGDTLEDKAQAIEKELNEANQQYDIAGPAEYDVAIVCDDTSPQSTAPVAPAAPVEIKHFRQEESVMGIQSYLIGRGHERVGDKHNNPDGMFGNGSNKALAEEIKSFQQQNGIEPTGEYNDATRQAYLTQAAKMEGGSAGRDALEGFVEGLDAMKNKDIDGHSALDRVYHPEQAVEQAPQAGMCKITIDTSILDSTFSVKPT